MEYLIVVAIIYFVVKRLGAFAKQKPGQRSRPTPPLAPNPHQIAGMSGTTWVPPDALEYDQEVCEQEKMLDSLEGHSHYESSRDLSVEAVSIEPPRANRTTPARMKLGPMHRAIVYAEIIAPPKARRGRVL